jgi:methyl-accepting chemotaxis protein
MILQALYFQYSQIGFVLFEVGPPDWPMYDSLRAQISSSLQGALLFEQAQQHTKQLDKIIAETMVITEEMQVTLSETSRQAQIVSKAARESMDVSRIGEDVVSYAVKGMETIQCRVDKIAKTIGMLSKHILKIEEIINTLEHIAD